MDKNSQRVKIGLRASKESNGTGRAVSDQESSVWWNVEPGFGIQVANSS